MFTKPSELRKLWDAPDHTRLTAKQYSFRLPVHVAAKLAALCELYPTKTRTEIVGDLLAAAINDVAASLPEYQGEDVIGHDPKLGDLYEVYGPKVKFQSLASRHYLELEKELGNESPAPLQFE